MRTLTNVEVRERDGKVLPLAEPCSENGKKILISWAWPKCLKETEPWNDFSMGSDLFRKRWKMLWSLLHLAVVSVLAVSDLPSFQTL